MAQPVPTSIVCPNCRHQYSALVEQLLDVGTDPSAKARLLNGQINASTCPNCGTRHQLTTPLMYHDPDKQLAITYMPMEIQVSTEERERFVGQLTTSIMQELPDDSPKGYLLQPKQSLTMQGLIEQVLEADGITRDMLDAEKQKAELVQQLAEATSAQRANLLDDNQHLLDRTFFDLLTMAAQAASQTGNAKESLRLLNIRSHLLDTTAVGQEIKQEQETIMEAQEELQALSDNFTREAFVDLLEAAAGNDIKVAALGQMGLQALDYTTFQVLSQRIDSTTDATKKAELEQVREMLLELTAAAEQQSRAIIERAANTLRILLAAPDISTAIQQNIDAIDDTFLQVLQANIQQARQSGNIQASARLKQVRDEVLALLQQGAPPEVRLINDLLSVPTEEESLDLLRDRQNEVTDQLLEVFDGLKAQLQASGNHAAVDRINILQKEAAKLVKQNTR